MGRVFVLVLGIGVLSVAHAARLPEETPYAVEILDVTDVRPVGRGDALNAVLVLSGDVPNSQAAVILRAAGPQGRDVVHSVLTMQQGPTGQLGRRIAIQFSPSAHGLTVERMKGKVLQQHSLGQTVTVVAVRDRRPVGGGRPIENATLELSNVIPNGDATLVIDENGTATRKSLLADWSKRTGVATRTIAIQARPEMLDTLAGKSVRVYSPELPERN